jgi:hypothetical protein
MVVTTPTIRRYVLPSIKGEGWAVVVIGSDGYFSTVSDWGNYAFWWKHHGRDDFREFVIGLAQSPDYFVGKVAPGKVWDGEKTEASVKREICLMRRNRDVSREVSREAWNAIESRGVFTPMRFEDWRRSTELGGYDVVTEWPVYSYSGDAVAYAKHVLPRLAEALRAELAAERAAVVSP